MISQAGKIAVMGMFIGAVAIAACLSQTDRGWMSPDELGLERGDGGARPIRSDTITGTVTVEPAAAPHGSTAIAGQVYAVRNSLQGNDLTTAQSQPEAVATAHRSGDQAPALQRNVQAQVAQMQPAPASAQADRAAQQGPKSAPASLAAPRKTGRADGPHAAPRGTSKLAYAYAKDRRNSESAAVAGSTASTSDVKTGGAAESVFDGLLNSSPAETEPSAQAVSAPPSGLPSEVTARAFPTSSPMGSQPGASDGTLLQPEGGPKTRAQVRAEIARARADGSLPAFGNPDPAGPGGAPSLTLLPRP
jgi:hypothetical protein